MPISRAAAEIEPVRAMAASRSALPGPIAMTAPIRMRIFGTSGLRIESAKGTPFAQETGSQYSSTIGDCRLPCQTVSRPSAAPLPRGQPMDTDKSAISNPPPPPVGLGEAFRYWLKLRFISFGGPTRQIALMHHDLLQPKPLISAVPVPYVVLAPGIVGYSGGRTAPGKFITGGHGTAAKHYGAAIIDDATPTPTHGLFRWAHFAVVLAIFLAIWVAALGALVALFGWDSAFSQMGWFFTKAALLTFGGAYAVLPYVYQGAVEHYQWLTATQMIDGLALGETTPGPLIMVVACVAFVGAWTKAAFGPEALALAGCAGAAVATFFTFLPSFLFILLGGPLVESTHGNLRFTAPLTGITAAVVGVVLNLAVFFASHVLWPRGFSCPFAWLSLLVRLLAISVLWRYNSGR